MSERPTTTFDFGDGSVENSTLSDIESSADRVVSAKDSKGNVFERIRHEPLRMAEGINWTKVGAVGTLAAVALAVVTLAATLIVGG